MKGLKASLVAAGLIYFLILLPNTASARIHFRIGFGTSIAHDHAGFYIGGYPHYRWDRGYYNWLDRDRYTWLDRGRYRWPDRNRYRSPSVSRPRHLCRQRPLYSSGVSVWINGCCPTIVDRPKVITKRQGGVKTGGYDEETAKLFEQLRRKKSELLKKLKDGNKEQRKEAIVKLAGFTYDDKVRVALEDVLLSDSDPELRREVASSLGRAKNKKVLPTLEKAKAKDSNEEVRQEAHQAIKKIKG